LTRFDPGNDIKKTRTCVVVSPDELNEPLGALDDGTVVSVLERLHDMFAE
jgi:mRNA-degrading endonuclease toxin of MazEF toxin-antitoxin module